MSTVPTESPFLAPVLSAVKDVDSNVRSELYAVDRNVGNNILASGIETKDTINRNSDFMLNDQRRNVDVLNGNTNRNSDFLLNDSRRNTEFMMNAGQRAQDLISGAVERNGTANILATQTAATNVGTAVERTGGASVLATQSVGSGLGSAIERIGGAAVLASQTAGMNVGNSIERIGASGILATQTAATNLGNAIDRTSASNVLATQTAANNLGNAIERTGAASVLAAQTSANLIGNAVERTGAASVLATEMKFGQLAGDTTREAGITRQLLSQNALEDRSISNVINKDILNFGYAAQIAAKDSEIKNAALAAQITTQQQQQGQLLGLEILKVKGDLEKQNLEIANVAARDSAALARQAAENTAAIQLDALRNKDQLSFQLSETYRGLKSTIIEVDSARLRDNQNDFRIENAFLRYDRHNHHHDHHGHHDHHRRPDTYVHNNLETRDYDRPRRFDDRDRDRERGPRD